MFTPFFPNFDIQIIATRGDQGSEFSMTPTDAIHRSAMGLEFAAQSPTAIALKIPNANDPIVTAGGHANVERLVMMTLREMLDPYRLIWQLEFCKMTGYLSCYTELLYIFSLAWFWETPGSLPSTSLSLHCVISVAFFSRKLEMAALL